MSPSFISFGIVGSIFEDVLQLRQDVHLGIDSYQRLHEPQRPIRRLCQGKLSLIIQFMTLLFDLSWNIHISPISFYL